jgi:hypothetical protein
MSDSTAKKQGDFLWKPGQSGNPSGRPKGSRAKLAEDFVSALYADWQVHGPKVIERVREEKPADFLKIIASILPKDINLRVNPLDDFDDDALATLLDAAREVLAQKMLEGEEQDSEVGEAVH